MAVSTLSASQFKPSKWNKPPRLQASAGFEFAVDGLYGVCFDRSQQNHAGAGKEVAADLYSTVLPADLRLVVNPYGGTENDYKGPGLRKVLLGNEATGVFLTDGFQDPKSVDKSVRRQIDESIIDDPCCVGEQTASGSESVGGGSDSGKSKKFTAGGRVCSRPFYRTTDTAPLTFHLKMNKVWGDFPPPHPEYFPDGRMDHFLIPSKAPNKDVIWLAFPRHASPVENKRTLEKWDSSVVKFAGFNGVVLTSDALKISVAFGATPKNS